MAIVSFFIGHWVLAGFSQTFFLHRYSSHRMFFMSKFWERFFYLFTFIAQGSSYLNPRAYAILHRLHHAYSDTEKDPHSPHFSKNAMEMMLKTYKTYSNILFKRSDIGKQFDDNIPKWDAFDRVVTGNLLFPVIFVLIYIAYYVTFATKWWHWLLLPVHVVMGPVHGAIVNWCGHKYGYRNYNTPDNSKNSLALDFLTLGELFQNNHHADPANPNLARKQTEHDLAFQVIKQLEKWGLLEIRKEGSTS